MNLQPMHPSPVPGLKVICVSCCHAVDARGVLSDLDGAPLTFYCLACLFYMLDLAETLHDAHQAARVMSTRVTAALNGGCVARPIYPTSPSKVRP